MRLRTANGIFAVILACASVQAEVQTEEEIRAIEKAHVAVAEVKADFKKALNEAIKKGDIKKALPGCQIKKLKTEDMKVGRTSHRLRNKVNAPPEWTKSYLTQFSQAKRSDIPSHVFTKIGEHRYGYLQPVFVEPICLNCHGRSVKPEVLAAIHESYPQDQAINFELGDFRGLLWVEMKDD